MLELLIKLEKLTHAIERRGVKFSEYLQLRQKKTQKLPIYRVKREGEYVYLYSDDDLAKLKADHGEDKELEIAETTAETAEIGEGKEKTDVPKSTFIVQEFFESREIEKISKEIDKFGVDIADYDRQAPEKEEKYLDKKKDEEQIKPLFTADETGKIYSLKALLEYVLKVGEKGMTIQRYKGLGEMNPGQLWETTMDPERRTLQKVTVEDAAGADEMFTILMGDNVEARRTFIIEHSKDVKNLDI